MPRARRQWSAIRAEIRRVLRETTSASSFWDDTDLLDYVNRVQDRWYMRISEEHEGWFTDRYTADLVADQREYTIEEGVDRIKRILIKYTVGGRVVEQPLRRDELWSTPYVETDNVATAAGGGILPTYRVVGELVLLSPAPTEARTDGLIFENESVPDRLTVDTSKFSLKWPAVWETLAVYEVVLEAFAVEAAQDLINPGARSRMETIRNDYAGALMQFVATKSHGRVFGEGFYLGD